MVGTRNIRVYPEAVWGAESHDVEHSPAHPRFSDTCTTGNKNTSSLQVDGVDVWQKLGSFLSNKLH